MSIRCVHSTEFYWCVEVLQQCQHMWYNLVQQNKQKTRQLVVICTVTPSQRLLYPRVPSSTASLLYYVAQSTCQHGYDAANDCDVCCTQSRSTHQLDGFRIGCSYVVIYKVSCGIHLLCCQCSALSADVDSSAQWSSSRSAVCTSRRCKHVAVSNRAYS